MTKGRFQDPEQIIRESMRDFGDDEPRSSRRSQPHTQSSRSLSSGELSRQQQRQSFAKGEKVTAESKRKDRGPEGKAERRLDKKMFTSGNFNDHIESLTDHEDDTQRIGKERKLDPAKVQNTVANYPDRLKNKPVHTVYFLSQEERDRQQKKILGEKAQKKLTEGEAYKHKFKYKVPTANIRDGAISSYGKSRKIKMKSDNAPRKVGDKNYYFPHHLDI